VTLRRLSGQYGASPDQASTGSGPRRAGLPEPERALPRARQHRFAARRPTTCCPAGGCTKYSKSPAQLRRPQNGLLAMPFGWMRHSQFCWLMIPVRSTFRVEPAVLPGCGDRGCRRLLPCHGRRCCILRRRGGPADPAGGRCAAFHVTGMHRLSAGRSIDSLNLTFVQMATCGLVFLIMSSLLLVLAGTMGDNGWNSRLHLLLCKQPLNRRKPALRWHEPKGPSKVTSWAERLGRRGLTADVGKHSRPSRRGSCGGGRGGGAEDRPGPRIQHQPRGPLPVPEDRQLTHSLHIIQG